ncbi:MAG: alpha/beta hydrolase, partial [Candidatus Thorarchaeota archaeon]|jgi:carboxylesterase
LAPDVKGVSTRPEGASVAFLLVHGFCAAPDEVATLGDYLNDLGIASFAVEVKGHASSSVDIRETSWKDWYSSVQQGLDVVKSWKPDHLLIAGLSMGGALSVLLSAQETGIDGLVLMAPALRISGLLTKFVPLLKYIMKDRTIDVDAIQKVYDVKRTKCDLEPISAYHELLKLQRETRKNLGRITIPTLILHGTDDKTIDPNNGQLAYDRISSDNKQLHLIQGCEHVITCHPKREIAFPLIKEFTRQLTG